MNDFHVSPATREGFKLEPNTKLSFNPADFIPFRDRAVCERVRNISGQDLEKREPWRVTKWSRRSRSTAETAQIPSDR